MTFHVTHNGDTGGPEQIDWTPLLIEPLTWSERIKGFLLAFVFTLFAVLVWGAAVYQWGEWLGSW